MTLVPTEPPGWLFVKLGDLFTSPNDDIVDGPFGSNLKATEYVNHGVPIARLQNIDRNRFVEKNIKYVTPEKTAKISRHTFLPDDILITKLGDPLGKACIAPASIKLGVIVADVVRVRIAHEWVDRRFLCYQINSEQIAEQFKDETKGTTRPRVNLTKIRSLRAGLCPLAEQLRIVEKLEELLSDLDAGIAELKAAKKKLGQYRQSLLKAAVDGTLTAAWREGQSQQPGERIKSSSELLERILHERRVRWEAKQLAKFAEHRKTPPNNWLAKYPDPLEPDGKNLGKISDGWTWATIDQLAQVGTGVTPLRSNFAYFHEGTIPWITSGALNSETVIEATELITDLALKECRLQVYPSGSLLVAMYGEGKTRGKCSELLVQATINQAIAALVFDAESQRCKAYLKAFLLTSYEKMREQASGGVQPNLNLQIIKAIAVPLPPVDEQEEIDRLLTAQFHQIDQQQAAVELALKQSAAQRQNILKAAFSGQLVPQDPNDEPAAVLLERIRAERAAAGTGGGKRGRKTQALA